MRKPITKALHTRRVVYQLASYLAERRRLDTDAPIDHVQSIYAEVLHILGNDRPADVGLDTELDGAVYQALTDRYREQLRARHASVTVESIRSDLRTHPLP